MNHNLNLDSISFPSEKIRQAHPLIKCIPQSAWDSYDLFCKEIPKALIDIMQAPDLEKVIELIQHLSESHTETEIRRRCIWLAVAFSHPSWSTELMTSDLAHVLQLDESDLLRVAIIFGNHEHLDWIISRNKQDNCWKRLFDQNKNEFIALAAKHGHVGLLEKLCLLLNDEQAVESALIAQNYQIMMDAAQYGHVPVLKFFMTNISLEHCMSAIAVYNHMPYRVAAKEGQIPVLMYFSKLFPEKTTLMFSTFNHESVYWAACNGQIAVLQYWAGTMGAQNLTKILHRYTAAIFRSNLNRCDLEMIQFLCGIFGEPAFIAFIRNFSIYSLPGHFVSTEPKHRDMLIYLRQLLARYDVNIPDISDRAIYLESMSRKAYHVIRYYTTILSSIELQQVFTWISTEAPEKLDNFLRDPASKDVLVFLLSVPEFWMSLVRPHKNNDRVISAIMSRVQQLHRMKDTLGELPLMSVRESKANYFLTCYCNESSNTNLNSEVDFLLSIPAVKEKAMESLSDEWLFFEVSRTLSLESRLLSHDDKALSTRSMLEVMRANSQPIAPTPPVQAKNPFIRSTFMSVSAAVTSMSDQRPDYTAAPPLLRPKAEYPRRQSFATMNDELVNDSSVGVPGFT